MAVPGRAVFVLLVSFIASFSASDTTTAQGGRRAQSTPNVFKLEELTYPDITALDRQKTMFLLPVGAVEEHGPHLPLGADTFGLMHEANGAAARVGRTLPDWNVVLMPPVNYGNSGANHIGRVFVHPGTYEIRRSTLRSLIADIGGQAAQNGFKWIFVLNGHGGPGHNISINEACDFVSETFGVTMLHVTTLFRADPALQLRGQKIAAQHFSAAELSSFGMDVHAGVGETSGMLAVRPDLVRPVYKKLPARSGQTFEELTALASEPSWQGYLSAPAKATAAYGAAMEDFWIDGFTDLIVRAVRGENMFTHPRFPLSVAPAVASMANQAASNEAAFEAKLEAWLKQRKKP